MTHVDPVDADAPMFDDAAEARLAALIAAREAEAEWLRQELRARDIRLVALEAEAAAERALRRADAARIGAEMKVQAGIVHDAETEFQRQRNLLHGKLDAAERKLDQLRIALAHERGATERYLARIHELKARGRMSELAPPSGGTGG